jgi:hypothetical integral membrane protein (TIGR02206 family)
VSRYFDVVYDGPPFILGSAQHLGALAGVILACVAIWYAASRSDVSVRHQLRFGLIVFCVINWLGWDAWQLANGIWSPTYSLPLHICTLSVPLSALMLATRSFGLYQVLYFWGFAGATNALLTPDLQTYGFPHFRYWIFFTSHGSIMLALVFAATADGFRPTWRSLGLALIGTNLLLMPVGLANWLTGGNYMYVARTPEFPTLIDYLGPWPFYIFWLELLALVAFTLVYLPYALADWVRRDARA